MNEGGSYEEAYNGVFSAPDIQFDYPCFDIGDYQCYSDPENALF